MDNKYTMRISEAANYLGVSIWTLRRWDKSGKLKAIRPDDSGNRRYRKQDLDEILIRRK